MLQSLSCLISLREHVRTLSSPLLNDTCQPFGSTASMLDHGLQQLLHALTHDTVLRLFISQGNQHRLSLYGMVFHIIVLLRRVRIFPRTAHRHRSSIQIRAAYSITARSASLRRPLKRCSVDLLHLDQLSWSLSYVGGTPRSFHARNYLWALFRFLIWNNHRIHRLFHTLNHWLLS